MIKKITDWLYKSLPLLYVIADSGDNSITFSRFLFRKMGVMEFEIARVFMFYVPSSGNYAFTINPKIDVETHLSDIQYNSKYRCIGFESLCPTVNRIFFDYSIPANSRCKLSVKVCRTCDMEYFELVRPHHGKTAW